MEKSKRIFMKKIIFVVVIMALFLNGCATMQSQMEIARLQEWKQKYEFDYSSSQKTGELVIQAVPSSQQMLIDFYGAKIDNNEIVKIFKYSRTSFILDEGEHRLEIFALPNNWKGIYGDTFGKPTIEQILIKNEETIKLEYMGPFLMWGKGKLTRLDYY